MSKKFLLTIVSVVIVILLTGVAVFFAKGYSISTSEKKILGTGIVTIKSEPDAASVYIDGHLTTATNATISSLAPKTYTIKVIKEGFIPWEKQIEIKQGIVTDLKVRLFPAIPTIYPLTYTGISNPVLSPDGSKLAYIVSTSTGSAKKNGIWVWTMVNDQPIAFARSAEPHQIAQNSVIDFSKTKLSWSPDSKQVLAVAGSNTYILEADDLNSEPKDITLTLSSTLSGWEEDEKAKKEAGILSIKDLNFRKIASESAVFEWSPDQTKFLARKETAEEQELLNKDGISGFKVYDLETLKEYSLPSAKAHLWLPDSRHIILVGESEISLVEFDGTNKAVIFAGTFADNFVFPWPDSSRFSIISSFPTPTASEPNLYGINLR